MFIGYWACTIVQLTKIVGLFVDARWKLHGENLFRPDLCVSALGWFLIIWELVALFGVGWVFTLGYFEGMESVLGGWSLPYALSL